MKTLLMILASLVLAGCSKSATNADGTPVQKDIPLPLVGAYKNYCMLTGTSSQQETITITATTYVSKIIGYDNTTCNGNVLGTLFNTQNGATYTVIYQNVNTYIVRVLNPDLTVVYKLFKRNNMGIVIDIGNDQSVSALQARRDSSFVVVAINTFYEM